MSAMEESRTGSTPRVYIHVACSLDGFIAGPNDDVSWLHESHEDVPETPAPPSGALEFESFMEQVGALLMGRRTHDTVTKLVAGAPWPYGETPVLVATHRELDSPAKTVRAVSGGIVDLIATAKGVAGDGDVYLDGGDLTCQALDAGLVDEIIITFIPILLSGGTRLFDNLVSRASLEFVEHHRFGHDKLQVRARVRRSRTKIVPPT